MHGLVLNDFPTGFLYWNGICCRCIDASLLQVTHVASKACLHEVIVCKYVVYKSFMSCSLAWCVWLWKVIAMSCVRLMHGLWQARSLVLGPMQGLWFCRMFGYRAYVGLVQGLVQQVSVYRQGVWWKFRHWLLWGMRWYVSLSPASWCIWWCNRLSAGFLLVLQWVWHVCLWAKSCWACILGSCWFCRIWYGVLCWCKP